MLHIIKDPNHLDDVLSLLQEEDKVLLTEDSVQLLLQPKRLSLLKREACFVLQEDALARGITKGRECAYQWVDFDGFVKLTVECSSSITW